MQSQNLSDNLRPFAPPQVIQDVYTPGEHGSILDAVSKHGPWKLIIAHHFKSLEELIATTSGALPANTPVEAFVSPVFRGYLAEHGVPLYEEVEEAFFSAKLLGLAKSFWGAKYASPTMMLFNMGGPFFDSDPGHVDSPTFRGLDHKNAPIWLLAIMGKSGLFKPWLVKMAQVITWFHKDSVGGGFTYWPEGPLGVPKRITPPMWNRGVVSQNEAMFHRAESFGPVELRRPKGLAWDSTLRGDPSRPGHWLVENGSQLVTRYEPDQMRLLVHWNAQLFMDRKEMVTHFDHLDDMTAERACEMLIADLKVRGVKFEVPTNPLADRAFIGLLAQTYAVGPASYPAEAPVAPPLAA